VFIREFYGFDVALIASVRAISVVRVYTAQPHWFKEFNPDAKRDISLFQ